MFSSERLTSALLDQLPHHVHILEMSGGSYKLKPIENLEMRTMNMQYRSN